MADRTGDFIVEAREHLAGFEESLLQLEKHSASDESSSRIERCFRAIHSVKGDAGFLGFHRIRDLAHAIESVLSETQPPISQHAIETLLTARDRLAVLVDDPVRSNSAEIHDIVERLLKNPDSTQRIPIDLNLSEWNEAHPGGIASLIQRVLEQGTVND